MSVLITSAHSLVTAVAFASDGKAPKEIVFLPEGSHRINPLSQKDGIDVHVPADKGESIAAALNTALLKRMGEQVKPWTDFEHTRKFPASGYPTGFRYEKGKGVMAAMDWSGSGRKAVEDRDVRYFSPEFYVGDDGIPNGLPERGPLGGLVTEPAFREIGPIAASDAGEEQNQHTPIMSKLIFAALAISAAAENAETEAVQKIEQLKAAKAKADSDLAEALKERDGFKEKVEAAEASEKKALGERADTLVKAAVSDGRILPKDEDKQNKFRTAIAAGDSFVEEMLGMLPKQNQNLGNSVVNISTGKPVIASSDFEAKAQQLVTAGSAPDLDTAIGMVADSDPDSYNAYLGALA